MNTQYKSKVSSQKKTLEGWFSTCHLFTSSWVTTPAISRTVKFTYCTCFLKVLKDVHRMHIVRTVSVNFWFFSGCASYNRWRTMYISVLSGHMNSDQMATYIYGCRKREEKVSCAHLCRATSVHSPWKFIQLQFTHSLKRVFTSCKPLFITHFWTMGEYLWHSLCATDSTGGKAFAIK